MHPVGDNVCIPLEHIHDGSDILFGGSIGCARILHKANSEIVAVLEHDGKTLLYVLFKLLRN